MPRILSWRAKHPEMTVLHCCTLGRISGFWAANRTNSMHPSSIRLHWVRVPLWDPFRISNGEVSVKDAILVRIEAGGTTGWGEASPLAGSAYSGETPQSTWDFLRQRLVPALLEQPELDPLRCFERLSNFPGEPFAKAGLEGAVWDLYAQQSGVPLWFLLGGHKRPLASGATVGLMPDLSELLNPVQRFPRQGGMWTWCAPCAGASATFPSWWTQTRPTSSTTQAFSRNWTASTS